MYVRGRARVCFGGSFLSVLRNNCYDRLHFSNRRCYILKIIVVVITVITIFLALTSLQPSTPKPFADSLRSSNERIKLEKFPRRKAVFVNESLSCVRSCHDSSVHSHRTGNIGAVFLQRQSCRFQFYRLHENESTENEESKLMQDFLCT